MILQLYIKYNKLICGFWLSQVMTNEQNLDKMNKFPMK